MSYIASSVHGLTLGALVLVENGADKVYTDAPSGQTYKFGVLDADTAWGNPQPVTETLLSLLANGSQVVHLRDDNREPSISVTIEASGAAALAAAEVALVAAVGKPAELRWQPPSSASAVTVFDIVWSELEHKMDSFSERYMRRSYSIKLQALPHARSATKVITPAVVTAAPTVVDSGSATTNWTAGNPPGASLSVVSGAVRSTYDPDVTIGGGYYGAQMRRAFPSALNVSVNKYVGIDWKTSLAVVHGLIAVNGVPLADLSEVRREPAPTAGYTRSWYKFADATTAVSEFTFSVIHPANAAVSATLDIDQVLLANALPASGTGRQKTATIFPGGSVPTEGTIHLSHATTALGTAMIFTHPIASGYAPPLRPWLVASDTVTANTSMISGAYNPITNETRFHVPVRALPRGEHHLWARMSTSVAGTHLINFSAQSSMTFGVGPAQFGSTYCTFPNNTDTFTFCLGRLVLPPVDIGTAGLVAIAIIKDPSVTPTVYLDEAWTFAMEEGRLTVAECRSTTPGPGAASNHLWVEAPSLDQPNGGLYVGSNPDKSDRSWPGTVLVDQVHRLHPEGSMAFYVTPNVLDASLDSEHYRRWHTNAGD